MNRRLRRTRAVAFLIFLALCVTCVTSDVVRWRADGLILIAIAAWIGMAVLCATDIEDEPDPRAHTSLDDREHA